MSRPAVCVVVPVYKAEATLNRCVESILSQAVPGGAACVLVEDGSPDQSAALCDGWAARDARVRVVHKAHGGGVSAARNAGLDAADADYIAFLDADDALRPGALAAALAAQAAAPDDFVIWHYTTEAQDSAPVTAEARPAAQDRLARLWLDCLIAMPWNKLYRADVAKRLRFDVRYTLGEDLQFVLDYLSALRGVSPDFSFAVLQSPLTFYDCSRTDTLSTKYHADYCDIWPQHFARLNEACLRFSCPAGDLRPLYRAELQVLAEGAADVLRRDPLPAPAARRAKARAALAQPWVRELLGVMRAARAYSPYYLPVRWRSLLLVRTLAQAARSASPLFGKLDWAGYYLLLGRLRRD